MNSKNYIIINCICCKLKKKKMRKKIKKEKISVKSIKIIVIRVVVRTFITNHLKVVAITRMRTILRVSNKKKASKMVVIRTDNSKNITTLNRVIIRILRANTSYHSSITSSSSNIKMQCYKHLLRKRVFSSLLPFLRVWLDRKKNLASLERIILLL